MIAEKKIKSRRLYSSDRGSLGRGMVSPLADGSRPGYVADLEWGSALEIHISETPQETRWELRGCLFGWWVRELEAMWKTSTRTRMGRRWIVVLSDVSFVDSDTEELFCAMSNRGVRFMANGLYIEGVLERLKIGVRLNLSGTLVAFFAALLPNL